MKRCIFFVSFLFLMFCNSFIQKNLIAQQLSCDINSKIDSSIVLDSSVFSNNINCTVNVFFKNKRHSIRNKIYLSSEHIFYILNNNPKKKKYILLRFGVKEPIQATLFINNDPEKVFNFYLDEGNYDLNIDCKNKTATVIGSPLNDEYKEMMRVHDSMYKKYNIMHAILYPYNGMDRDSAHAWLKKNLPLCDELSDQHIKQFYETHLSSFLTLEHVFVQLQYTFDDPGYDTTEYDIKKMKIFFDKLNPTLKRYSMYNECVEMFSKERVVLQQINKPLFNYEPKQD